ncbi:retrotransposon protein, putative, Ty1-copia subclass [Beauveria bassiana ARSEF 2860]|uniref:Retrotransposon protein, putative, Ty1-copia subclass n=1 Tax=Beauveria bassiana (strain ARSEF 2860) TaxID=655819 RepID=J4UND8_BEAB2|nr:retrotransposon protein, putative, Ty1-copia subclass [Beauveria bassiana ARSEF 2860]EJP66557.1 retrotransposon protein, putative, Ty1-copia subclass [Beauveria bassiana ARSEF 2860]
MQINQSATQTRVSQEVYINQMLHKYELENTKPKKMPIDPNKSHQKATSIAPKDLLKTYQKKLDFYAQRRTNLIGLTETEDYGPIHNRYRVRGFVNDLRIPGVHIERMPLYINNESAKKLTRNPEFHNRTKYINIRHHFIRERVLGTKEINTIRVSTNYNVANMLTKALPKARLEYLLSLIGMSCAEDPLEENWYRA